MPAPLQVAAHEIVSGTVDTVTLTSTTPGTTLIAWLHSEAGLDTFSMPANWIQVGSTLVAPGNDNSSSMWYLPGQNNAGGITSVACTRGTVSSLAMYAVIAEYPNLVSASPLDTSTTGTGSGTANPAPSGMTTTNGDDLLIVACGADGISQVTAVTSGWTLEHNPTLTGYAVGFADRTVSATGTYSPAFTGGASTWGAMQASFKIAAAAAPAPTAGAPGSPHPWFSHVTRMNLTPKEHVYGASHADTLRWGLREQMFGVGTQDPWPWHGPDETARSPYRWKQRRSLTPTEGVVDAFAALVTPIQSNSTLPDELSQTFGYYPTIPEFNVPRTVPTSLVVLATATRIVPTSLVALQTSTRTVPTSLVVLQTSTRTVPTSLVVLATLTRTVPTSLVVLATFTRTVPTSLVVLATSTRTVPTSLVVLASLTRMVPTSLVVIATLTRTVPTSLVVIATLTRTVPTSLVVLATSTRTVPTSLVVTGGGTAPRTVPTSLVVLATATRTVTTSLVVWTPNVTRTVPTSLVVLKTSTRTVPTSLVILQTSTRTVPTSAVLKATLLRTVPASLVAQMINIVRTVPTSLVVVPTGFIQPGTVGGTDSPATTVGGKDTLISGLGGTDTGRGSVGGKDGV